MTAPDLDKVIRIRSFCFRAGVLGRDAEGSFRQAFRTLNTVYVRMRDGIPFPKPPKPSKKRTEGEIGV